jgi:hypothetical protein
MGKGVRGDPESEGSPKQNLGTDVKKVDIRLSREGNRALDWESPKVIRNPNSKSASTGRMNEALPREISPTVAGGNYQTSDGMRREARSQQRA